MQAIQKKYGLDDYQKLKANATFQMVCHSCSCCIYPLLLEGVSVCIQTCVATLLAGDLKLQDVFLKSDFASFKKVLAFDALESEVLLNKGRDAELFFLCTL